MGGFNWLFIDMDSYFASAEQHLRPELRGRTVGVVPVVAEGTCVIAASIDAKRRGVKVGTPVKEARRRCPHIELVRARPGLYVELHHEIIKSVERWAPISKVYSIDEWSVRLRGKERDTACAVELARRIKQGLREDFSRWLGCSIGIAPSRLLAKIASDLKKPDGLAILHPRDLPKALEHCELDDLPGIAHAMLGRLHAAGVRTVRQLWALSREESRRIWGSVGGEIWWLGFHGHDTLEPPNRRHSMNHAHMLGPEHRNDAGAHDIIVRLLCKGAERLRRHDYYAHRLHVQVRGYDGQRWEAQGPLSAVQDSLTIVRLFESLWRGRPWAGCTHAMQFAQVAITLSGLTHSTCTTRVLFEQQEQLRGLFQAIDRLNRRYGAESVLVGAQHTPRRMLEDKIAFGRIPDPPPRA